MRPDHAVANLDMLAHGINIGMGSDFNDTAYHFVTEYDRQIHFDGQGAVRQVHIGAANRTDFDLHQQGTGFEFAGHLHFFYSQRLAEFTQHGGFGVFRTFHGSQISFTDTTGMTAMLALPCLINGRQRLGSW